MKKFLILVTVFALALALTGCGRTITPRHSAEYLFTDANGYAPSEIAAQQTFTVSVPGGNDDEAADKIIVNETINEDSIFEQATANDTNTIDDNADDADDADDTDIIDDVNIDDADSEDIFEDERTGDEPAENGWYDYIEHEWISDEEDWDYSGLPDYAARIEGVEPDITSSDGSWEYYSGAHVLVYLKGNYQFVCDNDFVKSDCEAIMYDLPEEQLVFNYNADLYIGSEFERLVAVYLSERFFELSFSTDYEVNTYYALIYQGTMTQFRQLQIVSYPDASQFDNIRFYVEGEDLGNHLGNSMEYKWGTNSMQAYFYVG